MPGEQTSGQAGEKRNGVVVLRTEGTLATIDLGHENEKAVVLTEQRMESLREAIRAIASNSVIEGLVICGSTPTMFCAGADVNIICSVADASVGEKLARMGQEVFAELERLQCRTVAAISGACVGGGCELVLACDHRLVTNLAETKIGLPEVKLGIIPGFGGTQRLPRLVGIRQALDIILNGRVVPAAKALRIGLIDKIVTPSKANASKEEQLKALRQEARDVALNKTPLRRRKPSVSDLALTYTAFGHTLVQSRARKTIMDRTKGHYPAPPRALDAVITGLKDGQEAGYQEEAKALGELVVTKECKSLVHVYFLTEAAQKLGRSAAHEVNAGKVAVLGGGTMGAGIATVLLTGGMQVMLVDPLEEAQKKATAHIEAGLKKRRGITEDRVQEMMQSVRITGEMGDIRDANIVIEAVPENLELKQEILQKVSKLVDEETIIASNTSSLSIKEIAARVSDLSRVIGMHFFNPAEKMPLVEIVLADETGERAIAYIAALAVRLGKYPIVVNEVPGFLVNRVLTPYLVEAGYLLEDGYSIEDIDRAATAFGMPMGPIRLLDEIGLDVASHVLGVLRKGYGERMSGPEYISKLVSLGRLGRKSGNGFYLYEEQEDPKIDPVVPSLLGLPSQKASSEVSYTEVRDRLIFSLVNEAVRSLDEGVAGLPGPEAAGQVDLGSVMGTGFPPFHGGVIRYAESCGIRASYEKLKMFEEKFGPRFRPCNGIKVRSDKNLSFYQPLEQT